MTATSIAETGAKPGQWVKCVDILETGHPQRFRPGKSYPVVSILGRSQCYGELVDTASAEREGQGRRNPYPAKLAGVRLPLGN